MENSLNKIHLFFKDAMPYMVLLIIVLLLVNIAKLREAQDDIARVQNDTATRSFDRRIPNLPRSVR